MLTPMRNLPKEAYHIPQRGYTDYVEGWRAWRIDGRTLRSIIVTDAWIPGRAMIGWCAHQLLHRPVRPPVMLQPICRKLDEDTILPLPLNMISTEEVGIFHEVHCNMCGCYAYKSEVELLYYAGPALSHRTYAFGKAALWGHIVEHETGYRAEFAYPTLIAGVDSRIGELADIYEVELCTLEDLYGPLRYIQARRIVQEEMERRLLQARNPQPPTPNIHLLPGGKK